MSLAVCPKLCTEYSSRRVALTPKPLYDSCPLSAFPRGALESFSAPVPPSCAPVPSHGASSSLCTSTAGLHAHPQHMSGPYTPLPLTAAPSSSSVESCWTRPRSTTGYVCSSERAGKVFPPSHATRTRQERVSGSATTTPGLPASGTQNVQPMQAVERVMGAGGNINDDRSVRFSPASRKRGPKKASSSKYPSVSVYVPELNREIKVMDGTWLSAQLSEASRVGPQQVSRFVSGLRNSMLEALASLYLDGIKPWLGDIAHRLRPALQRLLTLTEVQELATICGDDVKMTQEMRCKGEEGCVVYLAREPEEFDGFVDIHNTEDPFTLSEWRLFYQHMITLMLHHTNQTGEKPYEFRGGRYAFAELMQKSIKEFRGKRLGKLCHMVQIAIHNGALTYVNCVLQPAAACFSKTRALTKARFQPKESKFAVCDSPSQAMQIISLLTDDQPMGLVLAQLKQKFQREFNRDLNPELFGYLKLQYLLISYPFTTKYRLYTPCHSPHRTIIQNLKFPMPEGCILFTPESLIQTKFDGVAESMAPVSNLSDVSFEFLRDSQHIWSPNLSANASSWTAFLRAIPHTQRVCKTSSGCCDRFTIDAPPYKQHPSLLSHDGDCSSWIDISRPTPAPTHSPVLFSRVHHTCPHSDGGDGSSVLSLGSSQCDIGEAYDGELKGRTYNNCSSFVAGQEEEEALWRDMFEGICGDVTMDDEEDDCRATYEDSRSSKSESEDSQISRLSTTSTNTTGCCCCCNNIRKSSQGCQSAVLLPPLGEVPRGGDDYTTEYELEKLVLMRCNSSRKGSDAL